MYLYRISRESYDEGEEYILYHNRRLSNIEWKEMVSEAFKAAVKELCKEDRYVDLRDIVREMVEYLKQKHSFKEAEITSYLVLKGDNIISREELGSIGDFIENEILSDLFSHNEQYRSYKGGRRV